MKMAIPCFVLIFFLVAGECVINVYINAEKKFAFVEFRTGEISCFLDALVASNS